MGEIAQGAGGGVQALGAEIEAAGHEQLLDHAVEGVHLGLQIGDALLVRALGAQQLQRELHAGQGGPQLVGHTRHQLLLAADHGLDAIGHGVERAAHGGDLVAAAGGDPMVELARGDAVHGAPHAAQRSGEVEGQQYRRDEAGRADLHEPGHEHAAVGQRLVGLGHGQRSDLDAVHQDRDEHLEVVVLAQAGDAAPGAHGPLRVHASAAGTPGAAPPAALGCGRALAAVVHQHQLDVVLVPAVPQDLENRVVVHLVVGQQGLDLLGHQRAGVGPRRGQFLDQVAAHHLAEQVHGRQQGQHQQRGEDRGDLGGEPQGLHADPPGLTNW